MATIGLGYNKFPTNKQPGWVENSYGYHGDDGKKYQNQSNQNNSYIGLTFSDPFGIGDEVGCGVNFRTKEIFFTKNGKYLGVAFQGISLNNLYPIVGMDHSSVLLNFGPKFKFDLTNIYDVSYILLI